MLLLLLLPRALVLASTPTPTPTPTPATRHVCAVGRACAVGHGFFTSVQAAINTAHAGDTVAIGPGAFHECGVTLRSSCPAGHGICVDKKVPRTRARAWRACAGCAGGRAGQAMVPPQRSCRAPRARCARVCCIKREASHVRGWLVLRNRRSPLPAPPPAGAIILYLAGAKARGVAPCVCGPADAPAATAARLAHLLACH